MLLKFTRLATKCLAKCIFIVSATSFLVVACDSGSEKPEQASVDLAKPAKLLTVGESMADEYLNYPAIIQSTQFQAMAFQVGGVLKEVSVIEAESVKKGQVLARLDQRDYRVELNSIQAQFKNAEDEYLRAKRLIKEQAISRSVLDQRKSQFDVAKAQLDSAQKDLDDTVLRSPISGSVATVSIEVSQNVQAGEAAITILGVGGLEAKVNIPSSIVAHAQENEEKRGAAYVILDADQGTRIPAQFKSVVLEADSTSQTFEVVFAFKAPDTLNILPGMNATVWFKNPGRTESEGASVPLTAISTENNAQYVWVVDKDSMIVSKRKVIFQSGVGSQLNVLSGLETGETIVAAGVSYLTEGMKVRPWSK